MTLPSRKACEASIVASLRCTEEPGAKKVVEKQNWGGEKEKGQRN